MGLFTVLLFTFTWAADTYQLAKHDSKIDTGDFVHLQKLVEKNNFSSLESFLTTWKTQRPEYFSNYVLGYRSRSLQKSSPSHPRAIMFNKNADLVVAYNGHAEHKGFSNIELMRFNHDKKAFEFYEMSFANNKAQLSEPNPKKCLACHQSVTRSNVDPRPNWEPYNNWPGFYGSLDDNTDFLSTSHATLEDFDPILDAVIRSEIQTETKWLSDFRAHIQPTHPRYMLLANTTTNQHGKPNTTLNGDLTNRLVVLNFQRVARLIRTLPLDVYDFAKWGIWSHAVCGMTLIIKPDVFDWLYAQAPNNDYSRYAKRNPQNPNPPPSKHFEGIEIKYAPPEYKNGHASDVINMFIEAAGVSTEDWSMDFKTDGGRFAAFERFGVTNDPRPPWMEAIKNELIQDPELAAANNCDSAKQKAIEKYGKLENVKTQVATLQANNPPLPQRPLIDRCIKCHAPSLATGSDTPIIPFDDAQKLKQALQQSGYKRGTLLEEIRYRIGPHATEEEQMPKGAVPTSAQKEELMEYLLQIAGPNFIFSTDLQQEN